MRNTLALLLIFTVTSVQLFAGAPPASPPAAAQGDDYQISFTPDQLDNLLGPIALYPDPLLAQVLLAATFPEQIDQAARILRGYGNNYNIDATDWDVSVKAVAHYPSVLSMMADKLDWTTSVGQAYVNQSTDVMDAIQRLRRQARSYGNLVTSPQQQIVETDGYVYIYPAQPQYIYVPVYDPGVVYFERPFFWGSVISFGAGFLIGAWLNHDCDWHHHRVFYHGWEHGPVWVNRSRPFIHPNTYYVNRRFDNVIVNRTVIDRHVNYDALNRYQGVHRGTDFGNVRRSPRLGGPVLGGPTRSPIQDNKIIRRNINPYDPRIDANRGRSGTPHTPPQVQREVPRPEVRNVPPSTPPSGRQFEDRGKRPEINRTQPVVPPQGNVQKTQPPFSVFRGNDGSRINPNDASRRGQFSRDQANRIPPTPHVQQAPQVQQVPRGQPGRGGQATPWFQQAPRQSGQFNRGQGGQAQGSQGTHRQAGQSAQPHGRSK